MNIANFKIKVIAFFLSFTLLISTSPLAFAEKDKNNGNQTETKDTVVIKQIVIDSVIPGHLYIPAGTTFEVELTNEISSKKNKKDETVDLVMVDNLIINGIIIIPKGNKCRGIITESKRAGSFGRKGKLTIKPLWIKAINNIQVSLDQEFKTQGKSDGGAVAVAAVVSVIGGAFMKGTNAVYPVGTKFIVEVKNDTDLGATEEELVLMENEPQGKKIKVIKRN